MHTDLLDTVLVTKKDVTAGATTSAASNTTTTAPDGTKTAIRHTMGGDTEDKCPVDHKTRATWLNQARAATGGQSPDYQQTTTTTTTTTTTAASPHPDASGAPFAAAKLATAAPPSTSPPSEPKSSSIWSAWNIPFFSRSQPPPPPTSEQLLPHAQQQQQNQPRSPTGDLGSNRQVSSIPRSSTPGPSTCPANHEAETDADAATGNWVYPSERQFFDAMRRKGFTSPQAADMRTVVPIHNAVNERAWAEIRRWEGPYTGTGAGCCAAGPRLHSFAGVSERMSPRARMNTLLGYTAPFDRHDWVVDRCGTRVEYVIDFYAGKPGATGDGKVNFYLDVRPKLNSWEGVRMRFMRGLGIA